jgi:hypothetical protein
MAFWLKKVPTLNDLFSASDFFLFFSLLNFPPFKDLFDQSDKSLAARGNLKI